MSVLYTWTKHVCNLEISATIDVGWEYSLSNVFRYEGALLVKFGRARAK